MIEADSVDSRTILLPLEYSAALDSYIYTFYQHHSSTVHAGYTRWISPVYRYWLHEQGVVTAMCYVLLPVTGIKEFDDQIAILSLIHKSLLDPAQFLISDVLIYYSITWKVTEGENSFLAPSVGVWCRIGYFVLLSTERYSNYTSL